MPHPTSRRFLLLFPVLLILHSGCTTAEFKQRRALALQRVQAAETQRDRALAEGRATDALLWGAVGEDLRKAVPLTLLEAGRKGVQEGAYRRSLQQPDGGRWEQEHASRQRQLEAEVNRQQQQQFQLNQEVEQLQQQQRQQEFQQLLRQQRRLRGY